MKKKTIKESILDSLVNKSWKDAKTIIEKEGFEAEDLPENAAVAAIVRSDVVMVWLNKAKKVIAFQAGDKDQVI